MLQVLLEDGMLVSSNENTKNEGKLTEDELISNFLIFFIAGIDTTGHLITGLIYYLTIHTDIHDKIMEEINEFNLDKDSTTLEDINNKLPYLTACLKETLRIFGPAAVLFFR